MRGANNLIPMEIALKIANKIKGRSPDEKRTSEDAVESPYMGTIQSKGITQLLLLGLVLPPWPRLLEIAPESGMRPLGIEFKQMRASEYGEQDRKAAILYEYETFKATEGEQLFDTYLRYLQVINYLKKCGYKKDNCDVNEAIGYKKKAVVDTLDPLALVAEKTKVSKSREKVVVQSVSEASD
nr:sec7 domain-containing protein [Tanacetum cinerariifolium]